VKAVIEFVWRALKPACFFAVGISLGLGRVDLATFSMAVAVYVRLSEGAGS
jgi:hypothetical protein